MIIIRNLLLLSIAVFIVSKLLPDIRMKNFGTAVIVAVVYSFVSLLLGWILVLISFPLIIVTFGLFKFVINAVLLYITELLVEDFKIKGIKTTLLAAFFITVVDWVLRWAF